MSLQEEEESVWAKGRSCEDRGRWQGASQGERHQEKPQLPNRPQASSLPYQDKTGLYSWANWSVVFPYSQAIKWWILPPKGKFMYWTLSIQNDTWNGYFTGIIKTKLSQNWRNGESEIENTDCPSRGPRFHSEIPHGSSQPSAAPGPEDLMPLSDHGYQACNQWRNVYSIKGTHIRIMELKFKTVFKKITWSQKGRHLACRNCCPSKKEKGECIGRENAIQRYLSSEKKPIPETTFFLTCEP